MLVRRRHLSQLHRLRRTFPVVALLGARQVGKTTLARELAAETVAWFDLENPRERARLADPLLALEPLSGLVVIDELQRAPELFPVLRGLVDDRSADRSYLLLGSASGPLLAQGSETLAGRIGFHVLDGFDFAEVGVDAWRTLWRRGGFPNSTLAFDEESSFDWREQFVETFLSRDLPGLGMPIPPPTMRRFWTMLAHWHGQTWNGAEFGRAFGMSDTTVRRYLDFLEAAFAVRVLQPWFENLSKRQVRSPKLYIRDAGLLHVLLGLRDQEALESHPKVGASWEGFALAEVVRHLGARDHECFFWATHQGAELDLLVIRGTQRRGFEFKRTSTPAMTRSAAIARADLGLTSLDVVWPGAGTWALGEGVRAVGIADILAAIPPL